MIKKLINVLKASFKHLVQRKKFNKYYTRKQTLLVQIDFLLDTLAMNKLDIMYMENLKMPLSPDEKLYFTQQVDRINSAINVLLWMRENVCKNQTLWTKFFNWENI
jgi:hypothetical protein